jgi:hypothetical protein
MTKSISPANSRVPTASASREATLGELLSYLGPEIYRAKRPPAWPPDAFALAASALQRTGGYMCVASEWPPPRFCASPLQWAQVVASIGLKWRESSELRGRKLPAEIYRWWSTILGKSTVPLSEVCSDRELCETLSAICVAADEASVGAGDRSKHPIRGLGPKPALPYDRSPKSVPRFAERFIPQECAFFRSSTRPKAA